MMEYSPFYFQIFLKVDRETVQISYQTFFFTNSYEKFSLVLVPAIDLVPDKQEPNCKGGIYSRCLSYFSHNKDVY